jgi:tRNA (guanine10-N2)-dimethyltransferase
MKYLFELSKDHETIPISEVLACLKAENINYQILDSNEDVLVINTDAGYGTIKTISDRLSYTYYVDEFLFLCSPIPDEIKKYALKNPIEHKGSLAVKYKNRSKTIDSQSVVKSLAEIYTQNRKVSLKDPDIEIRGVITDSTVYVGLKLFELNRSQFEDRKVQFRPFFSPISLHPKLARALVNLSCIKKEEVLLDPFCGTGGILLEAGLINARVVGSDIEEKMIDGCKETLEHYNIKSYQLFCSDIGDIDKNVDKIDAVVTDLPYGKSTTTKGEEKNLLYQRAFENISNVLKQRGRAVIGLANQDLISYGEKYLSLLEKHEFKAHRSLTRYFCVYEK